MPRNAVKAARERNIRLLYLRFFTRPADSLVDGTAGI